MTARNGLLFVPLSLLAAGLWLLQDPKESRLDQIERLHDSSMEASGTIAYINDSDARARVTPDDLGPPAPIAVPSAFLQVEDPAETTDTTLLDPPELEMIQVLSGRVEIFEPDGSVRMDASGSLRFKIVSAGYDLDEALWLYRHTTFSATLSQGQWQLEIPAPRSTAAHDEPWAELLPSNLEALRFSLTSQSIVGVDGEPTMTRIAGGDEAINAAAGDAGVVIRLERTLDPSLDVRDRLSRLPLDRLTIVRLRPRASNPFAGDREPVCPPSRSPVALPMRPNTNPGARSTLLRDRVFSRAIGANTTRAFPQPSEHVSGLPITEGERLYVRSPRHAWSPVDFRIEDGDSIEVLLDPGGDLSVQLPKLGRLPATISVFRRGSANAILSVPSKGETTLELNGLPAGLLEVRAEKRRYEGMRTIASGMVQLRAGASASVELVPGDPDSSIFGQLTGSLVVPEAWNIHKPSLSLYVVDPVSGTCDRALIPSSAVEAVRGNAGVFSFRVPRAPSGRVALFIDTCGHLQWVDVPSGGAIDVSVVCPPPVAVTLDVQRDDESRETRRLDVRWYPQGTGLPQHAPGFGVTAVVHEGAEQTLRVAGGELTLELVQGQRRSGEVRFDATIDAEVTLITTTDEDNLPEPVILVAPPNQQR